MIKINLLKSKAAVGDDDSFAMSGMAESGGTDFSQAEQVDILKKIFVASVATIILMAYEWYNVDTLTQEANRATAEMNQMERKLKAVKDELLQYKDVQQESKILENKISILKALSKVRLREVKSLDFLQSITPEAVWFDSVDYRQKIFKLSGFAITDDALSALIKELESSIYFTDVILMKASEVKREKGTVKSFQIQANIGEVG